MKKITQEQINKWKEVHGGVIVLKSGRFQAYLKKPTRQVIGNALPLAASNPIAYAESILENCWLGGDDEIRNDDDYFMGVFEKLQEITQNKVIEVEKL